MTISIAEHVRRRRDLDQVRTAIEARLTGLSKRESELNDDISEIKKIEKDLIKLEKAYIEYNELQKKEKKLSITRESEIRRKEEKLEEFREKYKELGENKKKLKVGQPCPTCGQVIKDKKIIEKHFDEEMAKIKEEGQILKAHLAVLKEEKKTSVKDLKFDLEEYTKISKRLEELEDSHEKYPLLKAKVEKKSQLETNLVRIVKERKDLEAELKKILVALKEVPYDEKRHEKITEEFDLKKTELDEKYSKRNDLKLEIARLGTEANDKQKEIIEAEKTAKDIKEKTLSHEQQERFIMLATDYRQHLISRIRPKLSEISGILLSELTGGKYTGAELDEEYNLFIYDGNTKYPLQRFSGGEADVANLCLRLSISQLIAESSIARMSWKEITPLSLPVISYLSPGLTSYSGKIIDWTSTWNQSHF